MLPINITFPGQSANAIAATQSITATAGGGVILNGSLAPIGNLTPSATTAASTSFRFSNQPVVLAGIARTVAIFATTSATNCIFTVVGQNLRGDTITATVLGASGGGATATVANSVATTNGVDFHVITGVVSSGSIANFTVGTGATGVTNWCKPSVAANPQFISVGANLTVTGQTVSVESTQDGIQSSTNPTTVTNGPISNIVVTTFAGYTATNAPVGAIRGSVSGNLATSATKFVFIQAGY